ncbi:MAG: TIGR04283 family arsenosugar biosynthesis glycosyltransferase [Pseudomonadales bacterium]|nr:TIGR04283 family arsenosugar biosynthesis glycosyltransferase [Pseudomonadales bacterium]MBO6596825.1 TIGR04283 family arsenosugar biosynthesis glycosyltransferase [Pseudomonadales bacterium]MBO6823186.1 TIGR04283 family arsenosugar biosynthesis glycosyltransferase [Pseudomonadales bacterium]
MLSIIIPTLNEAASIGTLLDALTRQSFRETEVIVADGGSCDDTLSIAKSFGAKVIPGEAGRGKQLNAGANTASGEYLLFLHADSEFSTDDQLTNAMDAILGYDQHTAGHFPMDFVSEDDDVLDTLDYFAKKTRLNRRGTFNGDQGLLIRREAFQLLGGFSERYSFLEDQDFGERFIDYGEFITLPDPIRTSARRFEQEGTDARLLVNTIIMGMFHLKQDRFFNEAPGLYKSAAADRLNPLPFFELARSCVMANGFMTGLARCYRIGRYANQNLWQVFLWAGLRMGEPEPWLKRYDRYARPITLNPLGNSLATLIIVAWFFTTMASLSIRNR